MKPKLPDSVSSTQDLASLMLELHDYGQWLAHETIKQRVQAKRSPIAAPLLSPAASETMQLWSNGKPVTPALLEELLKDLQHYKETAPVLSLTLAAPPSGAVKNQLVRWCRDNIAPEALVSFQFSSSILGGMVVRYGSRVFDWSFRRQILAARDRFPEVLRHV